ncbi:nucleotidyltransferase domain-containing protein [Romeria aff. gracilis LEGE 07310]|uniref:Nucleotidyltransferase domain-containing protein n=1 Tax=Vasconcelosia minhoensis LEGE 07310 TaxID=915328 RepID=A0A8J7DP60_9CYAN|nr:nucleotidyltransferase domain-containing protein [Romeria gracilis]MBE9079160.1 nucleotidyltransferase domain-containing protein [Romeria aff. gracilis LEGE 07310]
MTVQRQPGLQSILQTRLRVTQAEVVEFCQRWNIVELALFGSVLRDDFRADSDVDVLVTYGQGHHLRFQDWLTMKTELERRFGRSVDVVEKALLKNPYRRSEILRTHQVIYSKP